jgi:segregation and condensation protein A
MELKKTAPHVELPVFQGPLDLLLHLIQQNKVDIYEIPIVLIADQFMAAITEDSFDMEITSEFLVLAAQLLYLKSRSLLPKPQKTEEEIEREEELKQELVERLVTYKSFKEIALYLNSKETSSGTRYFREINFEEIFAGLNRPNPLTGIELIDLLQAFQGVLARIEKGESIHYVEADDIPVGVMINDIMRKMIINPNGIKFSQLLRYQTKIEVVAAFVALLELLKDGKIRAEQSSQANEIFLVPTAKAWDFINEVSV